MIDKKFYEEKDLVVIQHFLENAQVKEICFEKGKFEVCDEFAKEVRIAASNHAYDEVKPVAFYIDKRENFVFDGNGSLFMFHDGMIPFTMHDCKNVVIKNLKIDFQDIMMSEFIVNKYTEEYFDLRPLVPENVFLKDGVLYGKFCGESDRFWDGTLLEYDMEKDCYALGSGDESLNVHFVNGGNVEAIGDVYRFHIRSKRKLKEGNRVFLRSGERKFPGILIDECENISIENVEINHCYGMAFIAQNSKNVSLRECVVTPSGDRKISVYADASHFVNCRGKITIEKCLFENQIDDCVNIHGTYPKIVRVLSETEVLLAYGHWQQQGVRFAAKGDEVAFIDNSTLQNYAKGRVADYKLVNRRISYLKFEDAIPRELVCGHCLENLSSVAEVLIENCVFRRNRARGCLLTTPQKVVFKNNTLESSGSAIKISGDSNLWFESGACKDVSIENNLFINCVRCAGWGKSVIDIDPEIQRFEGYYHKNIRVTGNRFKTFYNSLISGRSIDGFVFTNNRIEKSDDYETALAEKEIDLQHVINEKIENNNKDF